MENITLEDFHRDVVSHGVAVCGEDYREYWEDFDVREWAESGYTPEEVVSEDMSYWEE